jgi:hypothetical protein
VIPIYELSNPDIAGSSPPTFGQVIVRMHADGWRLHQPVGRYWKIEGPGLVYVLQLTGEPGVFTLLEN